MPPGVCSARAALNSIRLPRILSTLAVDNRPMAFLRASSTSEWLPFAQCYPTTARKTTIQLNKFVVYDMICLALSTNV
eukprot:6139548-Pyramimonas_sp.AAC.1